MPHFTSGTIAALAVGFISVSSSAYAQSTLTTTKGSGHGTNYGHAISSIGDINLDGYVDFAVGTPEYDSFSAVDIGCVRVISGLSGLELYQKSGSGAGAFFGYAISAQGDINGDGVSDYLVGSPYATYNSIQGGRAHLCSGVDGAFLLNFNGLGAGDRFGWSVAYGGATFLGTRRLVIGAPYEDHGVTSAGSAYLYYETGTLIREYTGSQSGEHFGYSVASARDCNSDFTPDVLVGAPHYDTGSANAGRVIVYSGASPYPAINTVSGAGAEYELGYSVSLISDINNDGDADFIAGAPGYSSDRGASYLYLGGTGSLSQVKVGGSTGSRFGSAVLAISDKNNDGEADYAVGAPEDTTGGVRGSVAVYSGASGALIKTLHGESSLGSDAQFGCALTQLDITNDSKNELFIGARGVSKNGIGDAGMVRCYDGVTLSLLNTYHGGELGNRLGMAATGLGDVNADQIPDYVVSAPFEDTAVLFFGATVWIEDTGAVRCYSGADHSVLWTIRGGGAGDHYGFSLARIKDITNDGIDDIAVGAPQMGLSIGGGYVHVLSGATGAQIWSAVASAADARFGYSVADAGDVNNNGVTDIVIGVPLYNGNDGRVVVLSGSSGSVLDSHAGTTPDEQFGISVAGIGDYSGDGKAELLVGASTNNAGGTAAGRIYGVNLATNTFFFTYNGAAGETFGYRVAAIGDVTDDGKIDFVASSNGASSPGKQYNGYIRAFASDTMSVLWTTYGNSTADRLGETLICLGDITGDGRAEVAAGGSQFFNTNYSGPGVIDVMDGLLGTKLYHLLGSAPGDGFGYGVGAAGDVNQDGTPDLIAGSSTASDPVDGAGMFKLISMWPNGVTRYGTSTPGCNGPQSLKMGGAATIGDWFYFGSNNVEPNSLGAALVTDSQDLAGSDLFGLGITLYVDFLLATEFFSIDTFGTPDGFSASGAFVPNTPGLVGQDYYLQQVNYWTQCSLPPLNLSATDAIKIIIQP